MSAAPMTLADAVWPRPSSLDGARTRAIVRGASLAVAGSVLLAASAQVQIPFWPVPFTMQTFAVLVIGLAYGSRLAAATTVLYLAEGAVGLPVFAGFAGGAAHLAGPTGGYLVGFAVAATVMGFLAERGWDRSHVLTLAAMLIGEVIVFTLGVGWLARVLGGDTGAAISAGLTPFVAAEVLKIALAVAALPTAWRLVDRTRE